MKFKSDGSKSLHNPDMLYQFHTVKVVQRFEISRTLMFPDASSLLITTSLVCIYRERLNYDVVSVDIPSNYNENHVMNGLYDRKYVLENCEV